MKFFSLTFSILLVAVNLAFSQIETVVILYTHNTNGVLENCKCPERSYGAIEKRAAVIDSIRLVEKNVLLLDSGDILDIQSSCLLHKYVVKAYDYLKYDFWTPGDQDFVEGPEFLIRQLMEMSSTLVSSNIFYNGEHLGSPYAITQFGKIRIGITGTIRDDLHKYLDPPSDQKFSFRDQYASLDPVINELEKKSDYIILLSHSGIDRDRKIVEKFPSIDLIIGGHSQTILSEPEKKGSTYITQVGESGYRIGVLKIQFNDRHTIKIDTSVILLTRNMSDDPAVVEMIKNYHQERLAK
jgi:5'-nucleotidase